MRGHLLQVHKMFSLLNFVTEIEITFLKKCCMGCIFISKSDCGGVVVK